MQAETEYLLKQVIEVKLIMNDKAVQDTYNEITKKLLAKGLTIATMESCTAGLLSTLLSNTEGASGALRGGFVTYCNEAKIKAGVSGECIATFGVYSRETAIQMAENARCNLGTDIGIGVTGSFGNPDPNNPDSVPGQVHFALAFPTETIPYFIELAPCETRYEAKIVVAARIAEKLKDNLERF